MYLEFFGLREFPFSLAPDPRFLYLSEQHREALAHLLFGVRSEGGFVQLTGEVGTGKTTVCRCFLEQLPQGTRAAVILNPRLSAEELFAAVCDEFEIPRPPGPATVKECLDRINAFLLAEHAAGRRAVLVIDEAQNLDAGALEQIRLLTNLETSRHKLLQIILLGQPELRATLARPELRQLAQRITARFHLGPLGVTDTEAYVRHRLEVAGCAETLFPPASIRLLRRLGGGVPRMINILADRALLGAFVQAKHEVDRATLRQAAREVAGGSASHAFLRRPAAVVGGAAALAAVLLALALGWQARSRPPSGPAAAPSAPAVPAPARASSPSAVEPAPAPAATPREPGTLAEADAFRVLFGLWGRSYREGGGDPCAQALAQGLSCFRGKGGLEELRRFDRPAVLALEGPGGRLRHAVLAALWEKTASLSEGGATVEVGLDWFSTWKVGEFTLLMETQPAVPTLAGQSR